MAADHIQLTVILGTLTGSIAYYCIYCVCCHRQTNGTPIEHSELGRCHGVFSIGNELSGTKSRTFGKTSLSKIPTVLPLMGHFVLHVSLRDSVHCIMHFKNYGNLAPNWTIRLDKHAESVRDLTSVKNVLIENSYYDVMTSLEFF